MARKNYGTQLAYGIADASKPTQTITIGGVTVYPTSVSVSKEGEVKEYRGPAGTVIALVIPEQFDQLSVEGYLPADQMTAAADIQKGDVCSITGLSVDYSQVGSIRLESWTVNWSNEDVAKVSATLKQYPDIAGDAS